jgi:hypothetical protein
MLNDLQRRDLLIDNSDTNQRIPDTSIVQDSSQSKTSSELGGIDSKDKFGNLASGLEQAFIMFKKGQVKASEAEIDRAQGGYLSTSALLEAQQNITNIYGKVSQQMTSAKQSGLLFDVARFSEKDAQFDGNLKSMEALSIGEFKATSKEIQARVAKGMAIGSALQSINQFVG